MLDLLVLWRGRPAWFTRGGAGHSSGGGGSSSDGSGGEWISYGGLTLGLDIKADVVRIKDQEISLRDTNVVLVDFVDSTAGATIVATRWIDPHLARTGDPVTAIIKRSPELFDFLRCDLHVPDAATEAMTTWLCAQLR